MCILDSTYTLAYAHACKCMAAKNAKSFSRKCGLNFHNPFPKFTVLSIKLLLLETSVKSLNVCSTNSTLGKSGIRASSQHSSSMLSSGLEVMSVSHQPEGLQPQHLSSRFMCKHSVSLLEHQFPWENNFSVWPPCW